MPIVRQRPATTVSTIQNQRVADATNTPWRKGRITKQLNKTGLIKGDFRNRAEMEKHNKSLIDGKRSRSGKQDDLNAAFGVKAKGSSNG